MEIKISVKVGIGKSPNWMTRDQYDFLVNTLMTTKKYPMTLSKWLFWIEYENYDLLNQWWEDYKKGNEILM